MKMTRRTLLRAGAGGMPVLAAWASSGRAALEPGPDALGVVIHSYMIRSLADRAKGPGRGINDPATFLALCRERGVGALQIGLGAREPAEAARLREDFESARMAVEGIVRLPADRADLSRFEAEVRTARQVGASILRTAMLSGRRYETFKTDAAFREFARRSYQSLTLAEPVVARQGLKLAVENHKDWRADELIAILKRLGSEHVGVCLDTGNSIALLEDPMEVVEALAPWSFTTHFKDMAVAESPDGFLLSEVPLGNGFLDLPRIVRVLRAARPEIRFNLEMITRDPLPVPCLTDAYWATFEGLPARVLARALRMVRAHPPKQPLPTIKGKTPEEQFAAEDRNVRRCITYARQELGLAASSPA